MSKPFSTARQDYQKDRNPNSLSISQMDDLISEESAEVASYFGVDGILAKSVPGFLHRPDQARMAQKVWRALKKGRVLLDEAGTGTGKSIGLLIPAILFALEKRTTVIVSTANKALQGQYRDKDLPTLARVLEPSLVERFGHGFKFFSRVGQSNYLCLTKLAKAEGMSPDLVERLKAFDVKTDDGDLEPLGLTPPEKRLATVQTGYCPGQNKCRQGGRCYIYAARTEQPDILVINHDLLAAALLKPGLLPRYGAVIIDEAHLFEDKVRAALETQLTEDYLLRIGNSCARLAALPRNWRTCVQTIFAAWSTTFARKKREALPLFGLEPDLVVKGAAVQLCEMASWMVDELEQIETDDQDPLRTRAARDILPVLAKVSKAMASLADSTETVSWLEQGKGQQLTLKSCPVSVGDFLRKNLWRRVPCVLASATLCTKPGDFSFLKSQLDIPAGSYEFTAPSPFDWRNRCRYVFGTAPESAVMAKDKEPKEAFVDRWTAAIWPDIKRYLAVTDGSGFILCTSTAVAQRLHQLHLVDQLPYPSACQGDLPKEELVERFKSTPGFVIYATSGFWEGIDAHNIRLVAIDRLPFASPDDVIESAKKRAVEAEVGSGRAAFYAYSVPKATYAKKQAVGRLLRNESGIGLVLLLDPRLRSKAYGTEILASLPGVAAPVPYSDKSLRMFLAGLGQNCRAAQGPMEELAAQRLREHVWTPLSPTGADLLHSQLRHHGVLSPTQWADAVRLSPALRNP